MIYLAGPWFNPRQLEIIEQVKNILIKSKLKFYSPKDEMPFNKSKLKEIYQSNIASIYKSNMMICITDGKDVGTIFEAGFAAAIGLPIVYLWVDHDGGKFNLMLSQSGNACYLGLNQFRHAMLEYSVTGKIMKIDYKGEQE